MLRDGNYPQFPGMQFQHVVPSQQSEQFLPVPFPHNHVGCDIPMMNCGFPLHPPQQPQFSQPVQHLPPRPSPLHPPQQPQFSQPVQHLPPRPSPLHLPQWPKFSQSVQHLPPRPSPLHPPQQPQFSQPVQHLPPIPVQLGHGPAPSQALLSSQQNMPGIPMPWRNQGNPQPSLAKHTLQYPNRGKFSSTSDMVVLKEDAWSSGAGRQRIEGGEGKRKKQRISDFLPCSSSHNQNAASPVTVSSDPPQSHLTSSQQIHPVLELIPDITSETNTTRVTCLENEKTVKEFSVSYAAANSNIDELCRVNSELMKRCLVLEVKLESGEAVFAQERVKVATLEGQLAKAKGGNKLFEIELQKDEEIIKLQQSKVKEFSQVKIAYESTLSELAELCDAEERVTQIQVQRDNAMDNLSVSERKFESAKLDLESKQKKSSGLEVEIKFLNAENEHVAPERERFFVVDEENIRLKEQIGSLECQHRKANNIQFMEYEAVIQRELHYKELQKVEEILKLQRSKIEGLSHVKTAYESTLLEAEERISRIQAQRDEAMYNLAASEVKVESAKTSLESGRKRISDLEDEIKNLKAENRNLAVGTDIFSAAAEENTRLKEQIEYLERQLGKSNDVVQFMEDNWKVLENELQKAEEIIKVQQSKIKELTQIKIEYEATIAEAEERLPWIQSQRDEAVDSLTLSEGKFKSAKIALESEQKKGSDLEEMKFLNAENENLAAYKERFLATKEENIWLKEQIKSLEVYLRKADDVKFMEEEALIQRDLLEIEVQKDEEIIKLQHSKIKELSRVNIAYESTLSEVEEQVTQIQAQKDEALNNLSVSERKIESAKIALESGERKWSDLEEEIKKLKVENGNLADDSERFFAIEEEYIQMKEQIESLEGQLEKANDLVMRMEDVGVKQREELATLKGAREKLSRSIIQDFQRSEEFKGILEEEIRWWYMEGYNDYKKEAGQIATEE